MKLNLKKLTAGLFSVLVFSLSAQTVQQRVDTVVQIAKNIIEGKTPEKYTYVPFVS